MQERPRKWNGVYDDGTGTIEMGRFGEFTWADSPQSPNPHPSIEGTISATEE